MRSLIIFIGRTYWSTYHWKLSRILQYILNPFTNQSILSLIPRFEATFVLQTHTFLPIAYKPWACCLVEQLHFRVKRLQKHWEGYSGLTCVIGPSPCYYFTSCASSEMLLSWSHSILFGGNQQKGKWKKTLFFFTNDCVGKSMLTTKIWHRHLHHMQPPSGWQFREELGFSDASFREVSA